MYVCMIVGLYEIFQTHCHWFFKTGLQHCYMHISHFASFQSSPDLMDPV